ncbi:TPA: hypothetical protein ACTW9A_005368 [Raoultella planticola]|uniref:hypothetical protein n=1 Tax=Raoultella planticola TaxID=575 RepID=UPI001F4F65E1|nr:hypothetical protein [Raoultella planticola]
MAELNPPLGTTTPEIFLDNVKRADELVNGPAGTVNDRAGEPLDTWRQMMAKNDEVRQNLIPLSKQYATLAAAQADIANIPVGSTTYYRSPDDSALAIEVMNVSGTLQPTGREMPSQQAVEKIRTDVNEARDAGSETWQFSGDNQDEVVLVADSELRKLVHLDTSKQKLVAFGNEMPSQTDVNEARDAGSETWQFSGQEADRIILMADSAGRIVRELVLSEQAEYLFGKKVGSNRDYIPPSFWPEFVDARDYGQSLSNSMWANSNAGPGLSTPTVNSYMFNSGITTNGKSPASLTVIPDPTETQFHDTAFLHQLQAKAPDVTRKYLAAASGVNGALMSAIAPGTSPWSQMMTNINLAAQYAANNGWQYGLPAFTFFQGEADAYQGSAYAWYRSAMRTVQTELNSKAKAVSRVDSDTPMFIYQMASHGRYQGLSSPSTDIPRAQLDEAIDNPLIQLIGPNYIYPYADGVHLTNHGYRWLGLFREKAIRNWMEKGEPWKPLYPENVFRVGGSTVVAAFHVPVKPLQFRADIVPEHASGSKGFELWQEDESGVLTRLGITSVQLIGEDKVKITSDATFTGTVYLAYAWTPLNRGASDGNGRYPSWNAGVNSGVAGNLCDSDDETTDLLDAGNTPYQLKNYCCIFFKEAL